MTWMGWSGPGVVAGLRRDLCALAVRIAVAMGVVVGAGCQPKAGPNGADPIVNPGPLPAYRAVAEAYNRRLVNLDRLWTYTSVRFWITDDEGKERSEVLDATLQLVLPSRLSLRLDKVSSTYALLGSNEDRYWWIELGDEPKAMWGAHAAVSSSRLAEIDRAGGLPVHPLDVIDLLGITPLPTGAAGAGVGNDPAMAWSPDGRSLLVTAPGRGGERRLWLDPRTFEASKVELLGGRDESGPRAVAWSELSKYVPVQVRMNLEEPRVASLITLNLPEARVELRISNPENLGLRPRAEAFDLDRLLKQYRVRDVRLLDEPAPSPNEPAEGP